MRSETCCRHPARAVDADQPVMRAHDVIDQRQSQSGSGSQSDSSGLATR